MLYPTPRSSPTVALALLPHPRNQECFAASLSSPAEIAMRYHYRRGTIGFLTASDFRYCPFVTISITFDHLPASHWAHSPEYLEHVQDVHEAALDANVFAAMHIGAHELTIPEQLAIIHLTNEEREKLGFKPVTYAPYTKEFAELLDNTLYDEQKLIPWNEREVTIGLQNGSLVRCRNDRHDAATIDSHYYVVDSEGNLKALDCPDCPTWPPKPPQELIFEGSPSQQDGRMTTRNAGKPPSPQSKTFKSTPSPKKTPSPKTSPTAKAAKRTVSPRIKIIGPAVGKPLAQASGKRKLSADSLDGAHTQEPSPKRISVASLCDNQSVPPSARFQCTKDSALGTLREATTARLCLDQSPDYDKLTADEQELCAIQRIQPVIYIGVKRRLFDAFHKCCAFDTAGNTMNADIWTASKAQLVKGIDVNKLSKIYAWYKRLGLWQRSWR